MSSSIVAMPQQHSIVVNNEWEKQTELIARTVAPGLNPEEFNLFLHVCRVRHLDPLQRQVHAVKRKSKEGDQWVEKMTIQTGIDGYRAIANRTGLYMPSDKEAKIEASKADNSDLRITMYVKKYHPISSSWHEFSATAYYREYVQTYKDNGGNFVPNSMWQKMPINQLTKCAEALALRKGWPEELGNIYTDEEMQHADSVSVLPPEPPKQQNKTQRDLGSMRPSNEPNRGHGNEGTQRTQQAQQTQRQPEKTMCAECREVNGHAEGCKMDPKKKPAPAATGEKKKTAREQWETRDGWDAKVHISFDDALQLFELQKNLKISEEDLKSLLDREFEIQHRHLIRQDMFQIVLDKIRNQYDPAPPPAADGTLGAGDGLFSK